ncbi:MAG: hypothetical protein K2X35_19150 [Bryobacteraceae bacterium]|nr:hypothetical protein [Bryobacteraceae bacterium]
MKFKTFSLTLATLAFGAISFAATSHNVTLFQPSVVNGQELAPGQYKVVVDNNKAVFSSAGKQKLEAPVKVETADEKFSSTSVRYQNGDGKYRVREIRVGGSKTRLVFEN